MTDSSPAIHVCQCAVCQASGDPMTMQQHTYINLFLSRLTESQRRWYVGTLSLQPNSPTDAELVCITGIHRQTIRRGRHELLDGLAASPPPQQRHPGGGRLRAEKKTRSLSR